MKLFQGQRVYRNKDGKVGEIDCILQGVIKTYVIKYNDLSTEKILGRTLVKHFTFLPDYDKIILAGHPLPANLSFFTGKKLDLDWRKV